MNESKIQKNTAFNLIRTLSGIVIPVIMFSYASRVLLPDNMGKIGFGNSIISYASLLASMGISTYATRECSKFRDNREQLGQVASEIYTIHFLFTAAAYALLLLSLLIFPALGGYTGLILILSSSIFFTTLGADWLNMAMEDFKYISIRTMVSHVLTFLLVVLLVKKPEDYYLYAFLSIAGGVATGIINYFYRKRYCHTRLISHPPIAKHIKPIIGMFALILSQTIFCNTDVTMLGLMRTEAEVGFYSTAVKIYTVASNLITMIYLVVLPQLSDNYRKGNDEEISRLQQYALRYIVTIGFPIIAGMLLLAPELMQLLFGAEYLASAPLLRILTAGLYFAIIGGGFIGNVISLSEGKEKIYVHAYIIGTVMNFLINLIFIPRFGAYAAAGSTVMTEAFVLIFLFIRLRKDIRVTRYKQLFLGPVIGSALFVPVRLLLGLVFKDSHAGLLFSTVIVCVLLYALILFLTKNEFFAEIMQSIKAFLNRRAGAEKKFGSDKRGSMMKTRIYVITIKPFECPPDPMYVPIVAGADTFGKDCPADYIMDNTGDNISDKNGCYSEFTATYWVWKNADCEITGINHYRRYFIRGGWFSYFLSLTGNRYFQKKRLTSEDINRFFEKGINCILPKKQYRLNHTMREEFEIYHSKTLLVDTEQVIRETKPEYLETYLQLMDGMENYLKCNCILPKSLFDDYCQWLFDVFTELEKRGYGKEFREFAFLGERLMNIWFEYQKSIGVLKIKELFYVNTDYRLKNILKNDTEIILPKWMRGPLRLFRKIVKCFVRKG